MEHETKRMFLEKLRVNKEKQATESFIHTSKYILYNDVNATRAVIGHCP